VGANAGAGAGADANEEEADDDDDGDGKEAKLENVDAEVLDEKTRLLQKMAQWATREELRGKRIKKLGINNSLDTILDEYYRVQELLGEDDSDAEDIISDEQAEEELETTEEQEKARMLEQLRVWWEEGRIPRPRRALNESSDIEDISLAYDKAADKLGVTTEVNDVVDEAAKFIQQQDAQVLRKKQRAQMLAQLNTWWSTGTLRKPRRAVSDLSSYDDVCAAFEDACEDVGVEADVVLAGLNEEGAGDATIVGGRALRNRNKLKRVEDVFLKEALLQQQALEDERAAKSSMLCDLKEWVEAGLYSDTADGCVPLKKLSKRAFDAVVAEYERVREALGMSDEEEAEEAEEVEEEEEEEEEGADDADFVAPEEESASEDSASEDEDEDDDDDDIPIPGAKRSRKDEGPQGSTKRTKIEDA
jgi:hypothetical protein